jgi:pimeloyl-ACP methyl ester carboxylesterase
MHTLRTQLDYFQRLLPLLTGRFTVYAVDLPGLGWSEAAPGTRFDEPSVRRSMIAFVERLGLDAVTLVGESIGATLALGIASELGARVARVVALNPYDYPQGVERSNLLASVVIKAMRIPILGLIPAKAENPLVLGGILSGGVAGPARMPADFVEELVRSGKRPGFAKAAIAFMRNHRGYMEARRSYGRVTAPVTLVYGERDWSKPAERDAVAGLIRGCRLVTLGNTGHFASMERPGDVARIVLDVGATSMAA